MFFFGTGFFSLPDLVAIKDTVYWIRIRKDDFHNEVYCTGDPVEQRGCDGAGAGSCPGGLPSLPLLQLLRGHPPRPRPPSWPPLRR